MTASTDDDRILIGIIADEDTTLGFLLAGIGEKLRENNNMQNFLIVREDDFVSDVEKFFRQLYQSPNVGVILIGKDIWKYLEPIFHNYKKKQLPIVMDIETKTSDCKPLKLREPEVLAAKLLKNTS